MQAPEFNKLMNGNLAKIANVQPDNIGLMQTLLKAQQKNATSDDINTAREEIKKVEVEISSTERQRMDAFIARQRKIGTKERTIRRMVQRMWNIQIV